ncbi:hypothetical protein L1887_51435 [Cichorium endivia]|nr:hypothetical protein L1887_51435 [Cichorium endivia]
MIAARRRLLSHCLDRPRQSTSAWSSCSPTGYCSTRSSCSAADRANSSTNRCREACIGTPTPPLIPAMRTPTTTTTTTIIIIIITVGEAEVSIATLRPNHGRPRQTMRAFAPSTFVWSVAPTSRLTVSAARTRRRTVAHRSAHAGRTSRGDDRAVSPALIGHVLAEDVSAASDLPPGPTTNVDGYAVTVSSTPPGDYKVVTLKTLQQRALADGEIFRINTGQGLPAGTDAVVMVEDTELLESSDGEEVRVRVLAQVDVGENVRPRASDVSAGQVVLPRGTTISALGGEIGTLAFLGRSSALVYRKPRIAILSTGNELVDTSSAPTSSTWGFNVYDANRPGLHAAIAGLGFEVVDLGIVTDDVPTTLAALRKGMECADVIVTTGGTSMGESDLLKPLIERELHGHIVFGRVAMKPGKPTTFATLPGGKMIFCAAGQSGFCTRDVLRVCAARSAQAFGHTAHQLGREMRGSVPQVDVVLGSEMRLDSRAEFHRASVRTGATGLVATSTGNQRSSGMHSMSTANALIALPPLAPNATVRSLPAGSRAKAMILGSIL